MFDLRQTQNDSFHNMEGVLCSYPNILTNINYLQGAFTDIHY